MIRIQNPKQCVRLRPVGATVILSKNPGLGTKIIELKFLRNYEGAGKKYCWLFRMAKGYSRANFVKRGRGGKETPNFTDWCFSEVPKSHWRLLVGTIMRPNIKVWSCEYHLYIIWLVADVFFALGGSHWSEVVNMQDTQSNWRQRIFAGVSVKYSGRALEDGRVWVMVPRRWDRRSAREDVRERDSAVRQWGMQLGGSISCSEPAWEIAIELSAAHPPPSHLINCTPPRPTFRARCT